MTFLTAVGQIKFFGMDNGNQFDKNDQNKSLNAIKMLNFTINTTHPSY